jgi:hypothetical protein
VRSERNFSGGACHLSAAPSRIALAPSAGMLYSRCRTTMRPYRTALLLILCFALPCIAQAQTAHLTAAEAKNHVGETATVCRRVASIHFAEKAKGLPTFMNLDMPYPQQIFTILIWGADRLKFGNPERTYRHRNVCVSRKITSHRGIPEIIISTPAQIQIQK